MSQARTNAQPNAEFATGTVIPHEYVLTILTDHSHRSRLLSTSVGAKLYVAGWIQFRRQLRAYFLNVSGNGGGRRQEDG
jgi:hypothetical protein